MKTKKHSTKLEHGEGSEMPFGFSVSCLSGWGGEFWFEGFVFWGVESCLGFLLLHCFCVCVFLVFIFVCFPAAVINFQNKEQNIMLIKSIFFKEHSHSTAPILSTRYYLPGSVDLMEKITGCQAASSQTAPFHPCWCSLCFQKSQPNCLAPLLLQLFQPNKPDWQRVIVETI